MRARERGPAVALDVVRLIAIGQPDDLLRVEGLRVVGQHEAVGQHIVDEIHADGAGITDEIDLDRCEPGRQQMRGGCTT